MAATTFHLRDLREPALWRAGPRADDGREMTERLTRAAERPGSRVAFVGVLGIVAIVAIALSAYVGNGAGSAASRSRSGTDLAQPAQVAQRPSPRDLVTALTRSGVGPDQAAIDLTYAPPMFFEITELQPPAEMSERPTLAFMLEETIHDGALPSGPLAVLLVLDSGLRASPYDVRVTATDPHHRTTRLLFADPARPTDPMDPGPERTLTLVVPFADGTVSAGNTFEWHLPVDLTATAPSMSPGASR